MYYESLMSIFESANKVTTITSITYLAEYMTCESQRCKKNIIFV